MDTIQLKKTGTDILVDVLKKDFLAALRSGYVNGSSDVINVLGVSYQLSSGFPDNNSNPYPLNIVKADINISTNDVTLRDLIFDDPATGIYPLKSIIMPLLQIVTDILDISNNTALVTLNLPALTSMDNSATINSNTALVTLDLPALASMNNRAIIDNNTALVTLNLPALTSMDNGVEINNNSSLTTLNLQALTTMDNGSQISTNNLLTTIIITSLLTGNSIDFHANALNQLGAGGVDDILNKLDVGGSLNGTVNLDGGTNATPSAAGLASKANLVGKGWTVTNN